MDVAAVTCASIHAGDIDNNIPSHLEFKVDMRIFNPKVRENISDLATPIHAPYVLAPPRNGRNIQHLS